MKRVLLLGDSIRMGYDKKVRELLKDEYEVIFAEEDNGRFAAYTLWQANQFFKQYGHFDLVHWNNGYWDMNIENPMTEAIHPVEEYVNFLKRIIRLIRENGAQIVFATTTPIYQSGESKDNTGTEASINYSNDWVLEYNAAACRVMEEERILRRDLSRVFSAKVTHTTRALAGKAFIFPANALICLQNIQSNITPFFLPFFFLGYSLIRVMKSRLTISRSPEFLSITIPPSSISFITPCKLPSFEVIV